MEPIFSAPNTTKAIEVLFFEEAEVTKSRNGKPSFATFGPMSVLYVPSYNRFLLQINDWRYPILRRFPISPSKDGSYTLPGPNGSTFDLKISKPGQGLGNLDALFEGSRKLEASPDDKLVRLAKKTHTETGPKEVITEGIKNVIKKVQNKAATLKTGTKYLTSTKRPMDVKSIKNKNFRKEARSSFKKDFFESTGKLSNEFLQRRRDNVNLSQSRSFDDLRKTSASHSALFYIPTGEVEDIILNFKEMSGPVQGDKKIEGVRDRVAPEVHSQKTPITEGISHYQG